MADDDAAVLVTLEDLKKANEKGEDILGMDEVIPPDDDEIEIEEDDKPADKEKSKQKDKPKEKPKTPADEDDDDDPDKAWLKGDEEEEEEEDDDGKPVDNAQAARIRRKYQAREQKDKDRIVELEARLKKIESGSDGGRPATAQQLKDKPKREAFKDDLSYLEALQDYKLDLRDSERNSQSIASQRKADAERENQAVEAAVDQHYTRAHALAEKSGITPDAYKAADLKVRQAVEGLFPEAGDAIVDKLISMLGEGSEKVFYHLGVNKARMAEFLESFSEGNGLKTATLLGELKAKLVMPAKRVSNAPAPGEEIQGDGKKAVKLSALHKEYKAAHSAGKGQTAFDIKKKAKAAGVDVSSW